MISNKFKTIFIHNPRTAGTSIVNTIRQKDKNIMFPRDDVAHSNHSRLCAYYRVYGNEKVENYFKFIVVRNPFERLFSLWKFRPSKLDFNEWLIYAESKKIPSFYNLKDWIEGKENYIIRYENFNKGWNYVCKKLKIRNDIKVLNKSKHQEYDYKKFYNNNSRRIVKKYFKNDLEKFNYIF